MNNPSSGRTKAAVYLDYFSLNCAPYSDDPDPRFFYAANTLSQRLDLLTHLTQFGDSIVVVAGPKGSGKTALLDHFVRRINSSWTLTRFTAADINDFRQAFAARMTGGGETPVKQILTDWMNRSQASDLLVVIIDDADQLTESAIRQLSELFDPAAVTRTRLVLFGTSQTGNLVKQAQEAGLFRGSTQFLEMPRLSDEDTAAYLVYRMAVAGYSGESPFSPTQVGAISKASDGRPAEINRLADQCLLEQYEHAASRMGGRRASIVHRVLPAIAVMLGLAVVVGLWQVLSRDTNNPPDVPLSEEMNPADATPAETSVAARDAGPAKGVQVDSEPGTASVVPAEQALAPPASPDDQGTTTVADAGEQESAARAMEIREANTADSTTAARAESSPANAAENPQPAEEVAPPSQENATVKPADGLAHREDWLLSQNAESYTLQLLGSRNERAARGFIEQLGLQADKVSYYKGLYKGGDWYVVVYGVYPSRSAAAADIENLPESLRAAKPWPRPIQSVQEAIRATQNP